jgi:hypothetical protein
VKVQEDSNANLVKGLCIRPYTQYWVLIAMAFCFMVIAAFAFFVLTPLSQKIHFLICTIFLGFIIHWLVIWTSVCVTFDAYGIKRESSLMRKKVFTKWEDIHFVYRIRGSRDRQYILLSSQRLDSSGIKSAWLKTAGIKSFFQTESIGFRIGEVKYEQLIEHIRSNPVSKTIVIANDVLRV